MADVIDHPLATIRIYGGIAFWVLKPNAEITLQGAREVVENHKKLNPPGRLPAFGRHPRHEIRDGRSTRVRRRRCHRWHLPGLGLHRRIAREPSHRQLLRRLNRPPFPAKLFTSEADALVWLRGYQG